MAFPRAPPTVHEALPLRDAPWADDSLREALIAENPAGLSAADLAEVASWKHRVAAMFTVWKHDKKHTTFLHGRKAFAVLGLRSTLEEILPRPPPVLADAVLLPFDGVIVIDGLMIYGRRWMERSRVGLSAVNGASGKLPHPTPQPGRRGRRAPVAGDACARRRSRGAHRPPRSQAQQPLRGRGRGSAAAPQGA